MLLVLLAVPGTAVAHEADLAEHQAETLAGLPPERRDETCGSTASAPGLGRACRTEEGLFRVVLPSGDTMETHGLDAPAEETAAAPHRTASQAAIDGASVADITCVTDPADPHTVLVYAHPADRTDRSSTAAPQLRTAAYRASAFMDAEAQALNPSAGRRLRVLCDSGGVPIVHTVTTDPVGTATGTSFSSLVSQLTARGYPTVTSNSTSPRRVAVFYDFPSSSGAAGTANLYLDDSHSAANANNKGGRYAVEFDWAGTGAPHWDILLHELAHNMGAVASSAPDTSGGGHCNDGLDVMCYSDGGSVSAYSSGTCSMERFDCGADSYFHPTPAAGAYLDTHWNVASELNAFLHARVLATGELPDTEAPTAPGTPTRASATPSSVDLSWASSTDARSAVTYLLRVDAPSSSGAWTVIRTIGPTATAAATVTGLSSGVTYRVRVRAVDASGNESADAVAMVATGPSAPSSTTVSVTSAGVVAATWSAVAPPSGLARYDVELLSSLTGWGPVAARSATGTSSQFEGVATGTWRVRVRAVDTSGAASEWRMSDNVTVGTTLRAVAEPVLEAPGVSVTGRTVRSISLTWTQTAGATSWDVTLVDETGDRRRSIVGTRSATFTGLRAGRTYAASVVALAEEGAVRSAPTSLNVRTTPDVTAPTRPRVLSVRRARAGTTVRWAAAGDDVSVVRYEVQRRVGARRFGAFARFAPGVRAARLPVARGARTTVRVRAVDAAGNVSAWATVRV